jgi:hypothetical protein
MGKASSQSPPREACVASWTHRSLLGCGPRVLHPMVNVGHDYNAQGQLDTRIARIMWEERALGQADKQGRVTHGLPVPSRQISHVQGKRPET